ncbi:hypothetical protein WHZ77_05875 [Bradyrhizobium sp. A5]|uniref:hypothetical protein n=1 Tax=Bradyrhizobium sp. A5 TaxID=3133696 RepID=UPI0032448F43
MRSDEINKIVASIDETRRTEHFRNHDDRPDARTFKPRPGRRVPKEIVRAQTRLRSAAWRVRMDSRAAPSSREIGMALVYSLITSRLSALTFTDEDIVGRALLDLQARGFSITEARNTLRRLRNRYVDPGDREGEPNESCGPAPRLPGEEESLPF